jgi:hypothetical protein
VKYITYTYQTVNKKRLAASLLVLTTVFAFVPADSALSAPGGDRPRGLLVPMKHKNAAINAVKKMSKGQIHWALDVRGAAGGTVNDEAFLDSDAGGIFRRSVLGSRSDVPLTELDGPTMINDGATSPDRSPLLHVSRGNSTPDPFRHLTSVRLLTPGENRPTTGVYRGPDAAGTRRIVMERAGEFKGKNTKWHDAGRSFAVFASGTDWRGWLSMARQAAEHNVVIDAAAGIATADVMNVIRFEGGSELRIPTTIMFRYRHERVEGKIQQHIEAMAPVYGGQANPVLAKSLLKAVEDWDKGDGTGHVRRADLDGYGSLTSGLGWFLKGGGGDRDDAPNGVSAAQPTQTSGPQAPTLPESVLPVGPVFVGSGKWDGVQLIGNKPFPAKNKPFELNTEVRMYLLKTDEDTGVQTWQTAEVDPDHEQRVIGVTHTMPKRWNVAQAIDHVNDAKQKATKVKRFDKTRELKRAKSGGVCIQTLVNRDTDLLEAVAIVDPEERCEF